jgi:probable phosphoglycerate mutase
MDRSFIMPTRLLLVRHGASHHKEEKIVAGPKGCRGLTDTGRAQAASLAVRLAGETENHPVAIYTSIIPRAIETAGIVAEALGGFEVIQDCGLCTWHIPAFADGMKWADYQAQHNLPGGGVFRPFQAGNESWSELVTRVGRALEEIASRHANQTVLIVAHTETVNAAHIVFGNLSLSMGFDSLVSATSITEWITEGDPDAWPRPRWSLMRGNDTAHLFNSAG